MPSHYAGSQEQVRALSALINLLRAADSLRIRLHRPLHARGLTLGQFGVLEALHHLGPLRQNELARKLLNSPGNLSIVLDNLERRKLIRRAVDRDDRRCTQASLTDKGRRLIESIFPPHVERVVEALAPLSAAEQETLRELCRRAGRSDG